MRTITIPIVTNECCAGSSVPDDWQNWRIKGFRDVRAVRNISFEKSLIGIPVVGDSLQNIGILHGDILITLITDDYKEERIGIWQTPHGRTAKYAYEDLDGMVVLHNKNGWVQRWQPEEIKLIGIVVRVERDME